MKTPSHVINYVSRGVIHLCVGNYFILMTSEILIEECPLEEDTAFPADLPLDTAKCNRSGFLGTKYCTYKSAMKINA